MKVYIVIVDGGEYDNYIYAIYKNKKEAETVKKYLLDKHKSIYDFEADILEYEVIE